MPTLTDQENKLLRLLVEGTANKLAAKRMGLSLRTVELRRQRLMKKFGAETAFQLGYIYAMCKREEHPAEIAARGRVF